MRYWTDIITHAGAAGWALPHGGQPVRVEAWCDGRLVGSALADRLRPDVALAFPQEPGAARSGFSVAFELSRIASFGPVLVLQLRAELSPGTWTKIGEAQIIPDGAFRRCLAAQASAPPFGAFPQPVMNIVNEFWPDILAGHPGSDTTQRAIADRLFALLASPRGRTLPLLAEMGRFLSEAWSHFLWVERYFPESNANRSPTDKDFRCKTNSPTELISIAFHLYVLKSYGVTGDFAEFGCFKGYSTSMLSYACRLLGTRMHVFDSFEGLPRSDSSSYDAGDFAGGFEEVRENVRIYGAPEVVTFHKGYFANTLPNVGLSQLMTLWMDVDLASSARDVMTVVDRIDARGALFSHECAAANFADGIIMAQPSPDSVIPPIVQRFRELGATLTGRYIFGDTGAFWRPGAIPVLSNELLRELITAVTS